MPPKGRPRKKNEVELLPASEVFGYKKGTRSGKKRENTNTQQWEKDIARVMRETAPKPGPKPAPVSNDIPLASNQNNVFNEVPSARRSRRQIERDEDDYGGGGGPSEDENENDNSRIPLQRMERSNENDGLKESAFFLTLSTNMRKKIGTEEIEEAMWDSIQEVFATNGDLRKVLKKPERDRLNENITPIEQLQIVKPTLEGRVEEGLTKKGGRIHFHGILKFRHNGKVHIDVDAVREKINQKLVTKLNTNRKVGVYFQAKAIASTLEQLEEYIMKQENKFGNTERVQELKRQRDALMGHLQEFQFFDSNEN